MGIGNFAKEHFALEAIMKAHPRAKPDDAMDFMLRISQQSSKSGDEWGATIAAIGAVASTAMFMASRDILSTAAIGFATLVSASYGYAAFKFKARVYFLMHMSVIANGYEKHPQRTSPENARTIERLMTEVPSLRPAAV